MKSDKYWEGRFIDLQRSQLKRADSFAHELEDLHARMQKEIDDDITVWHKKVATANGISMADAKKLMSRKDRKEFQWTLEEYEQHAKADLLSGVTSANVMNASANWHLSYLDGMKLQLEHHVDKLYKNIDSKTRNHFKESLNENYLNTAFELQKGIGIGEKMEVPYDERKLENILRTPWASDGKNFSQRIWKDRTQLVNNLQKNLSESVIRGDSDTDMIQALSKDEKRAEFNTRRLVETESAFFDSESERQCCEDFGIEKYRFLAVLDMKTSDICQELDNKVFLEKERQVGVNAPPMHPFCRSTTAPVIDEDFLTSRRAKNIKTGEYDEIPPEMNYKQWKEKYVEGKDNAEEVKQEQVKTESSNGAKVEVQVPKIESEYKETPIPPREEKFDSNAYENRVKKQAEKRADEAYKPIDLQEKQILIKQKTNNLIEHLESKVNTKEITKELADKTKTILKEIEKNTEDIVKEFEGIELLGESKLKINSNGQRGEKPLTKKQIKENTDIAVSYGMPRDSIGYEENSNTGYYGGIFDWLVIGTDIYPQNMKTANGRLSNRATLAHEIIGHREANKKGWTITEDTILEEIQASIRAARFAPNLTNKERFNLLRDAGERAKKNNIKLKDIKHTLHINKR